MKRFTETEKWRDPWFRRLPPRLKLLWGWLCDQCDNAGVIDVDIDCAVFQIGEPFAMDDLASFAGRLEQLPNGKWWLSKFIDFQYGKLSPDCKAHNPVFTSIARNSLSIGYAYPLQRVGGRDQEKEKEKDIGECEGGNTQNGPDPASVTRDSSHVTRDAQPAAKAKVKRPALTTDDEWIAGLQAEPANAGLSVSRELARAQMWCNQNNRQCSRKFFCNWLLKAERTVTDLKLQQPSRPSSTQFLP